MASLNFVQLICRVGNDPEVRQFDNGNKICSFRAATTESYTDRNNQRQEQTEWHSITLNGKLADLAPYIYKGSLLYVGGKIRTRSWTDQTGQVRYQTEIVGTTVQLLSPRRDAPQQVQPSAQAPQYAPAPQPGYVAPAPQAPAPASQGYQQFPPMQGYAPAPQAPAPAPTNEVDSDLPF